MEIFALGEITLDLDVASLNAPVPVIEEIRIGAPRFLYEVDNRGGSNLTALQQNLKKASGSSKAAKSSEGGKEQRFRIKQLSIAGGRGDVDLRPLGGQRYTAQLERIVLTNLGGRAGLTGDQLAQAILDALLKELQRVAVRQGTKELLRGAAGDALRRLQGN